MVLLFYFSSLKFPFLLQLVFFTAKGLSKYVLKERMSFMIERLPKVIYLLASNRGAGVLRRVMVKKIKIKIRVMVRAISRGLNGWLAFYLI